MKELLAWVLTTLLSRKKINKRTVRCPGQTWHILHLYCLCKPSLSLLFPEYILCGLLLVFADGCCPWVCSTQLEGLFALESVVLGIFLLSQQRASASVGRVMTWSALTTSTLLCDLLTGAVAKLIMRWTGVPELYLPLLPRKRCSVSPQPSCAIWSIVCS